MNRVFSCSVMLYNDGKFLLIDHKKLKLWLPVGGKLEPNETPLEAGRREVREETGLECEFIPILDQPTGTPDGFLGYEEHEAGSAGVHMNFCFLARANSRNVVSDGSFSGFRWIGHDEVISMVMEKSYSDFHIPRNVIDLFYKIHELSRQNLIYL